MGICTNPDEFFNFIHLGWPELATTVLDHGTSLSYSGPLQKACTCVQRHKAFRGTSSDGSFLSQQALGLSSKFWHRCFTNLEPSNSLRDGEKCGDSVSGFFPSLSSAVSSLNMLYTHWKERKLCRSVLKDFALGEDPELFFKRCPGGEFTDDYGLNCTVESWSPVSHSSGYDAGTRTSRKRSLRRSTSSNLKKARTGTSRTMEGPWFQVNRRCVAMAMVVVRCACLGVVLCWYIRLASILVERWRALIVFTVFRSVPFKSGNRHLITGRSHTTVHERNLPIVPIPGLSGENTTASERRRVCRPGLVAAWFGSKPPVQLQQVFGVWKEAGEIWTNPKLREHPPRLSSKRLICLCLPSQECHADSIIAEYKLLFPDAHDREDTKGAVPSSAVLLRLSELREEQESDGRSSTDENVPEKGSGWYGCGSPLLAGSSYTAREVCDGQSLASLARWAVEDRRYPEDPVWSEVAGRFFDYAEKAVTTELLTSLAWTKVSSCPFPHSEIEELKRGVVDYLRTWRYCFGRRVTRSLGDFSRGVRVGRGVGLPRLPALCQRKRKCRLPDQDDPTAYLESEIAAIRCVGKTTLRLRSTCPESGLCSMIRAAVVRH